MRSFILLVACLASLNPTWAKDEFLLRNYIPAQHHLLTSVPYADGGPVRVLLYSTESKTWLPPLFWQRPANFLQVSLDSTQPHFVRLCSTKQTIDLGYVDFHRLCADQKQPPLLALYVAKLQRRVAKGETYTKQVTEAVTKELPVQVPKTKPITREVAGTNPTTNKPENFAVQLPVQQSVTEMVPQTKLVPVTVKEVATADMVIDDEHIALGVQEILAVDQESLEPAVERPSKPAPAAKLPADQAMFRLLQVTPPGTSFAIEPTPHVWLYSTKDKDWREPLSLDTRGLSGPLPLNPGLHYLSLTTATYSNNIGYVDFAAVSQGQKNPLFVLETLKQRLQLRQVQEYLRSVPSFVEVTKNYTVQRPVTIVRSVPARDPNTGETIERPEQVTKMVEEQRTTVERIAIIKTEKATATKDETIEQEMPRLSLVRELEVDRQQKAPELPHPTPNPEIYYPPRRADSPFPSADAPAGSSTLTPVGDAPPPGRPSFAPAPAPVPAPAPLPPAGSLP